MRPASRQPQGARMTIAAVTEEAAGILQSASVEAPLFEAQLLLAPALGVERLYILTRAGEPVSSEQWDRFTALVSRRAGREPLAYIRGIQEFYGLEFEVDPAVLVPRP